RPQHAGARIRRPSDFHRFETGVCSMTQAILRDISGGVASRSLDLWEPVIITGEQIDAEIERLVSLPRPANGRREAMIIHPRASAPCSGLTPGIGRVLGGVKSGETMD